MTQSQAYLNGRFVPASEAAISVIDGGLVQGTIVAEQLRTFGGRLFRLSAHVERLFRSLAIVQVEPAMSRDEFARVAEQLAAANHAHQSPADDLGLAVFVTPGPYAAMATGAPGGPTVCMHTFPLRFDLWVERYETGQSLATTDIVQVPAECWPSELKCRSRMHYYLADREAEARYPGSRALMLDQHGLVTETTTSNIVVYDKTLGLLTPPRHKILPGISLAVLAELAGALHVNVAERALQPADILAADEVFLTGTSACIVPVVQLNGRPIGGGRPGPMFARFMAAWSDRVGLNIVEQAKRFARRDDAARVG